MDPYSSSSPSHRHHHHHRAALTFIPPPLSTAINGSNGRFLSPLLSTPFDPDDEHLNSCSAEEESDEACGGGVLAFGHHTPGLPHHGLFPFAGVHHPYALHNSSGIINPRPHNGFLGGSTGVNYGYGDAVNVATPCGGGSSMFYLSRSALAMAPPPRPSQVGVRDIRCSNNSGAEPPIQAVLGSVPVLQGKAAAKRLRLFGVNMDCPISDSGDDDLDCEVLSSSSISHAMPIGAQPSANSSRSSGQNPHLQLRLYNGMPLLSKSNDDSSSSTSMPLDLDINLRRT
ncbi:hypothetical protein SAY86_029668 [Trapa natans]|uniref:Uncharacterized protein n=1 Tax=Trapa natans TaxID=22666 RepID=A0AAN7RC49_TRANT|nr:hypothetical protein SAY86_029668 [Trapa natans]